MANIDPLSASSLFVELLCDSCPLGSATGFVVSSNGKHFLITNWHVVSGCDPETGCPLLHCGIPPERLRIYHHGQTLGTWVTREEVLHGDDASPRWIEHPNGKTVDVAALPLEQLDKEVALWPLDLALAQTDMIPRNTSAE